MSRSPCWGQVRGGIMFGLDRASKKPRLEYVTTESVQLSARPPLISSSSYLDRLTPHCVRRVARSVHLRVAGCSGGLLGGRWTIGVPSRALRGNEITLSAQVVRKFSLEDREDFQTLSGKMADCFAPRFSAHGSGIQITAEVGIDPASYLNRQYQRRVRAPSVGTELRGRKLRKLNATGTELQTPVALEGARCMS
jgi:hypothetical protein